MRQRFMKRLVIGCAGSMEPSAASVCIAALCGVAATDASRDSLAMPGGRGAIRTACVCMGARRCGTAAWLSAAQPQVCRPTSGLRRTEPRAAVPHLREARRANMPRRCGTFRHSRGRLCHRQLTRHGRARRGAAADGAGQSGHSMAGRLRLIHDRRGRRGRRGRACHVAHRAIHHLRRSSFV